MVQVRYSPLRKVTTVLRQHKQTYEVKLELLFFLIIWGLFAWGVAALASSRGRSAVAFFLVSFLFSPILALIILLVMSNLKLEAAREEDLRQTEQRRADEQRREHEKQLESLKVIASASKTDKSGDSSRPTVADELKKLAELKEQGVLTEEEFNAQKAKLLAA